MHNCQNQGLFLYNLRRVNEQAGVDKQIVDIMVAFARLKMERHESIDFYPDSTPKNDPVVLNFLEKNRHIDKRASRFLAAYFHEVHRRRLCCILNSAHLAHLLNITLSQLKQLSTASKKHYFSFHIHKHNGQLRKIDSPKPQLKRIQRKILDLVLQRVPLNSHAEGYVRQKSILTNARRHIGKEIVIRMDISNFFPSITFPRVVGAFEALGYPYNVAEMIGKLTTHDSLLPIGAPTSPAISNIICRKLDKRFVCLGQKCGFNYSRYADDIAISSSNSQLNQMIPFFDKIIREEGFMVNQTKTIVMRNAGRQKITGVVVNQKTNAPREEVRKLRAVLHNCFKNGTGSEMHKWAVYEKNCPEKKYSQSKFRASLLGRINYVRLVNPIKGEQLLQQFNQLNFNT
ncbi:MAG: reverse transcriptase family protein [Desulfobacterales bacterium]